MQKVSEKRKAILGEVVGNPGRSFATLVRAPKNTNVTFGKRVNPVLIPLEIITETLEVSCSLTGG